MLGGNSARGEAGTALACALGGPSPALLPGVTGAVLIVNTAATPVRPPAT